MTLEDLSAYETLLTDPLIGEFNGYDVISCSCSLRRHDADSKCVKNG